MRTADIIISIVAAVAVAATMSVGVGVLIALACLVEQAMLEYGRAETGSAIKTVREAYMLAIVRNGMFLIPPRCRTGRWFVGSSGGNRRGVWDKPYDVVRSVVGHITVIQRIE